MSEYMDLKELIDKGLAEPIYCPCCGRLAYIRDKNAPKIDKVVIKIGDKTVSESDVKDLPRPQSLLCPWCICDIPVEEADE